MAFVDLEAGRGGRVEHRRRGGADAAAHGARVIALAAEDHTAEREAVGGVDRPDGAQEAELLAGIDDLTVEVDRGLADVLAETVAHIRVERRRPAPDYNHIGDVVDAGDLRVDRRGDDLHGRCGAAAA